MVDFTPGIWFGVGFGRDPIKNRCLVLLSLCFMILYSVDVLFGQIRLFGISELDRISTMFRLTHIAYFFKRSQFIII